MTQNKVSTKISEINIGDLIVSHTTYYLVLGNEVSQEGSQTGKENRNIKTLRLTDYEIYTYTLFSSDTLWVISDS